MIAASRTAGSTPRRCAAAVACVLLLILWPAASAALDRVDRIDSFLGTVQAARPVRGRVRASLRSSFKPTALVTVKIEIVTLGGHPFKAGQTIVLPLSHPEKAFGLPGKGYEFLGGALGRTYEFHFTLKQVGRGLTITRIDVYPLYQKRHKEGGGMVLVGPARRKPEPLPPDERPSPGIYTRHPIFNHPWPADICAGADGLIYLVSTYTGRTTYTRSPVGLVATGAGFSCFAVFDVKKSRLTVLERGLRNAQRICSAGNRVYWLEKGTARRRYRDGRLSVYDIAAKTTKVLLDNLVLPRDVAAVPDGNVYVLEESGTLSVVGKDGTERTTIALDPGRDGLLAAGPTGDLFVFHIKRRQPGTHEHRLFRFPAKGGERELVTDAIEGFLEDLATDAKGNVYLVDSAPSDREFVTIRVLVGGDPRKTVPLSTDHADRVAVLPNGDLLKSLPT